MDGRLAVPREVSAYKSTRGRPKKFIQPWNTMMKRIYISEKSWVEFRQLKEANGFSSDDATLQYLLEKRTLAEAGQHSATFASRTSPVGSESLPLYHSTPRTNVEHRLPRAGPRVRLVYNMEYV